MPNNRDHEGIFVALLKFLEFVLVYKNIQNRLLDRNRERLVGRQPFISPETQIINSFGSFKFLTVSH